MTRKKTRPQPGDPLTDGMSERDIAALGILSRRQIQSYKAVASIPENIFEQLIESGKPPSMTELVAIGRGRNPARRRARCCPNCGFQLQKKSPLVNSGLLNPLDGITDYGKPAIDG